MLEPGEGGSSLETETLNVLYCMFIDCSHGTKSYGYILLQPTSIEIINANDINDGYIYI